MSSPVHKKARRLASRISIIVFGRRSEDVVVDWQAPKNGINKNQPAPSAKEMRLPTSQVFVDRGDQWLEVSNPKFVWGDGEAKVC